MDSQSGGIRPGLKLFLLIDFKAYRRILVSLWERILLPFSLCPRRSMKASRWEERCFEVGKFTSLFGLLACSKNTTKHLDWIFMLSIAPKETLKLIINCIISAVLSFTEKDSEESDCGGEGKPYKLSGLFFFYSNQLDAGSEIKRRFISISCLL